MFCKKQMFDTRGRAFSFTEIIIKTDSNIKTQRGYMSTFQNLNKRGISQHRPFTDPSPSVIISLKWLQLGLLSY